MQAIPTDWSDVEATARRYHAGEVDLRDVAEAMRHFSLTHSFVITVEMLVELTDARRMDACWAMDWARLMVWPKPVDPPRRPSIPSSVRSRVFDRDGHRCKHCGDAWDLELDHIHPFSKGGSNEESNLQVLCRRCNRVKFDSLPE